MPEAEIECSCLQRTQVEDNLINGINPLGRDSKQCFQVSSDLIYHYKNGIKPKKLAFYTTNIFTDTNSKDSPLTCQMGFSLVCNSNRTTHNRTAICPPDGVSKEFLMPCSSNEDIFRSLRLRLRLSVSVCL